MRRASACTSGASTHDHLGDLTCANGARRPTGALNWRMGAGRPAATGIGDGGETQPLQGERRRTLLPGRSCARQAPTPCACMPGTSTGAARGAAPPSGLAEWLRETARRTGPGGEMRTKRSAWQGPGTAPGASPGASASGARGRASGPVARLLTKSRTPCCMPPICSCSRLQHSASAASERPPTVSLKAME